jgi:cytochrome c554/c'-like protein
MTRDAVGIVLAALLGVSGIAEAGTPTRGSPHLVKSKGYTSSEVCAGCHEDIHRTWKNSLHAMSLSDPIFDAAYWEAIKLTKGAARPLCLRCHAPTTRLTKDYEQRLPITEEGVTCDFCHTIRAANPLAAGEPYSMRPGPVKWGTIRDAQSPAHKVEYSLTHTMSELCGGCHEYRAPSGALLMGTYSEWRASPYAEQGVQCQTCHMPMGEGRVVRPEVKAPERHINLHDIQGGHSPDKIRKAARVEVREVQRTEGGYRVVVTIENEGSGHMIPTGIPTRQLELEVLLRRGQSLLGEQRRVFRKVVVDQKGEELRTDAEILLRGAGIRSDNRIPPKGVQEVNLFFPYSGPPDFVVEATLHYRYSVAISKPEEITLEMATASRPAR